MESDLPKGYRGAAERSSEVGVPECGGGGRCSSKVGVPEKRLGVALLGRLVFECPFDRLPDQPLIWNPSCLRFGFHGSQQWFG